MKEGEMNVTRSFYINGMPLKQWTEWKRSAVDDYGDCYWLKAWSDHMMINNMRALITQILTRLDTQDEEIEMLTQALEGQEPIEKKEVSTFGK